MVYQRSIYGSCCSTLNTPFLIQTILSVPELHRILLTLADFTADRELHPAPKAVLFKCYCYYTTYSSKCKNYFGLQKSFVQLRNFLYAGIPRVAGSAGVCECGLRKELYILRFYNLLQVSGNSNILG